ncbi:MAG TPA: LPS assembly lipoprotein LptE [Stellaceae bacterium]|nr:LPS assembly lipoprotein LptE [Stellaceae bacterium]
MIARRLFLGGALALPAAALAGCGGWEPLYADPSTGPASADLRAIKVAPIPERIGQRLEMALRNSLNPGNEATVPRFLLRVSLGTSIADLGIQSQGLGTRGEVSVTASYRLTDMSNGNELQSASMHVTDSFDIQANGYSTVVAQDDAYRRAVEELRREIVVRLTLFMQNRGAAA